MSGGITLAVLGGELAGLLLEAWPGELYDMTERPAGRRALAFVLLLLFSPSNEIPYAMEDANGYLPGDHDDRRMTRVIR